MPKKNEIYKCMHCGNVIEFLHGSDAPVICCGEEMKHLAEGTTDAAKEKHVPVIEKTDGGYTVTVGSTPHPMEEKHYIELIELHTPSGEVLRQYLNPGDEPKATFCTDAASVTAREYCNLHSTWKAEL